MVEGAPLLRARHLALSIRKTFEILRAVSAFAGFFPTVVGLHTVRLLLSAVGRIFIRFAYGAVANEVTPALLFPWPLRRKSVDLCN